jgi:very-long-chain (3R)-3-hydroxyacyl-CoA dehydratase
MQVTSRLFILWGIVEGVAGTSTTLGVLLIAYAWSITEVIRYSYYFFALINAIPYVIKWCRYTTFYVLYPIGVMGELMLAFTALPVLKASEQWSLSLPNPYNIAFSFYYFTAFGMALYIPFFPQLYGHMIKQRQKVMGGKTKEE